MLALAACGDDSAREGRGQVSADDLDGLEIVEGSEVVVAFADGAVSIRAGCNTQSGGYDVVDGVLQVDATDAGYRRGRTVAG